MTPPRPDNTRRLFAPFRQGVPVPLTFVLCLVAAALAFAASRHMPGWTQAAGRTVVGPVSWLAYPLLAIAVGVAADPFARPHIAAVAGRAATALQPVGEWFHAPRFPLDLLALLPLLAVLLLDVWREQGASGVRSTRPAPGRGAAPRRGTAGEAPHGEAPPTTRSSLASIAMLAAVLLLALAVRWTGALDGPPSSDTVGYFNTGRDFWARVGAEGTNPVALAYLNVHPNAREPLYPVLLSAVFGTLGPSIVHQREVTVLASVANVGMAFAFGRAALGPAAGVGAAVLLALEPWHISMSQEGLREPWAILFVYGLALVTLLGSPRRLGTLLGAGALGAAAVLTRLDAGATVMLLLAWLSGRLGRRWRHSWPAWLMFGALVAPLLIANQARSGEALTPLGSSMGGDIQAAVAPLLRGEMPLGDVLRYVLAGTLEVYRGTLFGEYGTYLGAAGGSAFAWTALALFGAGLVALAVRGPHLVALVATIGVFVPPFVYIAGTYVLGGPGGGYTERYTYMIAPAVFAITSWSGWQTVQWATARAARRIEWRGYVPES